ARPNTDEGQREALRQQLLAFAGDEQVQALLADGLANEGTSIETRLLLLEVMAQAAPERMPTPWVAALQKGLADSDARIVQQTIATLRAMPQSSRPVVSRIDSQVNNDLTEGPF